MILQGPNREGQAPPLRRTEVGECGGAKGCGVMAEAFVHEVAESKAVGKDAAPKDTAGRIPELDGLRGLAILQVIVCHYVANAEHSQLGFWPHRILSALTVGWSGVDLFFVLSGFLIGGILLDARKAPHYFRTFYMRRVHRILPIYYLWTGIYGVLVAGAIWLFPGRYTVVASDLLRVPVQLLFLQNIFIGMPAFTWMWFVVTWSLAVEEQFYLVAPPVIRFISRRKLVISLVATVLLAPVLRFLVFRYWMPGGFAAAFLMPCRADGLALGILLAIGWRRQSFQAYVGEHRAHLQGALMVLLVVLGGLWWWLAHPLNLVTVTIGFTTVGIFYSGLLLLALSQTRGWVAGLMRGKYLGALGTISYCIYVVHDAFNQLAHRMLLHAPPQIYNAKGVGVTLLALMLTLAVASISWRCFEKPLIRRGHAYAYGGASAP